MIILGLTGPIGHGKSTFANAVAKIDPKTKHFESSDIVAEVINKWHATLTQIPPTNDLDAANEWLKSLPGIVKECVHVDISFGDLQIKPDAYENHPVEYSKLFLHIENLHRNPGLVSQTINEQNKEAYRPILQWVGGYLVKKIGHGVWYDEMARRVKQAEQEGYHICLVGGLRYPSDAHILQSMGGNIVKIYRPGHLANDILDPTERERESIPIDCTIVSDGTVEDVDRVAKQILRDLKAHNLQIQYIATAVP
jgi:energy-coupling factor transporter ATP-binding protein EcfA2